MALLGYGCARCGCLYPADGITVLAQRDEGAFVRLVCSACQSQTLALVTGSFVGAADDEIGPAEEAVSGWRSASERRTRRRPTEAPSVSEADVLAMTSFLADYHGDIRGLFDRDCNNERDSGSRPDRRNERDCGNQAGPR